jgi:hypothetical protein
VGVVNYNITEEVNSVLLPIVLPLLTPKYTKDEIMKMTYREARDLAVAAIERLKNDQ